MIEKIYTTAKCPYCGHKNRIGQSPEEYKSNLIINCDLDSGGCDEFFAIFLPFIVSVESQTAKIGMIK